MSTIKVTNLQDTSGGNQSTSEQIAQGRAKAGAIFKEPAQLVSAILSISVL